ncbi:hypothetical protein BBJ28_00004427 [Nothophytophthora sp. Chile5]|nr:hypothetical protein BBJ28_00004427 [Nothophytophthora sp. Chile5]
MEAVERAERELGGVWRYVSTSLALRGDDASGAKQRLTFSVEEEQVLEEKVSEGIASFQHALTNAQEWVQELQDPKEAEPAAQTLAQLQQLLKSHVVGCRKVLVAYRQRAKVERLEHARSSLLSKSSTKGHDKPSSSSSGSAVDVTAALKRTRQVMSQEIERVGSVTKVLGARA